jgi:hypothetical protein
MARALFIGAVIVATGAAALGACSSDDGPAAASTSSSGSSSSSTGGGGGSGGGGGASGFGATPCAACAQMQCASEVSTCEDDPDCPAYLDCLLACPVASDGPNVDLDCVDACDTGSSSESKIAAAALRACVTKGDGATECDACGKMPVQHGSTPSPETCSGDDSTCANCYSHHCCTQQNACAVTTSACSTYIDCVTTCTDGGGEEGDCNVQCAAGNDDGVEQFSELFSCAQASCMGCSGDPCDSCTKAVCDGEAYAIFSDPKGFELFECFDACLHGPTASVEDCQASCYTGYAPQLDAFENYEQCLLLGCKDACSGNGG